MIKYQKDLGLVKDRFRPIWIVDNVVIGTKCSVHVDIKNIKIGIGLITNKLWPSEDCWF